MYCADKLSVWLIWFVLLSFTVAAWSLGEFTDGNTPIVPLVLVMMTSKAVLIAACYMRLIRSPVLWQLLVGGWIVIITGIIGIAFLAGV